jgi:hypothetical protein
MTLASVSSPNRPLVAAPVRVASPAAEEPKREANPLKFRLLPGSGAPVVGAETDPTLGNTGPIPWVLSRLEKLGPIGAKVAHSFRFATRLIGPSMYAFSAYWNLKMLPGVMRDKTIKPLSKGILAAGSGFITLGAICSAIAALPVKLAAKFGLGMSKLVTANKVSGISGGLAEFGFSIINMVETLRDKAATPTKRFFAKLGFGLGTTSFLTGSAAMILSMTGRPGAAVGVLSKVATIAGLSGLVSNIGQAVLGKNSWLNKHLQGTWLG